ncbi:MAG: archease [Deltaproteobacteria bacterium]
MPFKILDHTADIRVGISGKTFEELLKSAALGLMSLITDRESVEAAEKIGFEVEGENGEEILIRMLGEILYLHQAEKKVFRDIDIKLIATNKLQAVLHGEKTDPRRHELELDIKAATYHNLKIVGANDRLMAEVVFDI